MLRNDALDELFAATVEASEEAVLNALAAGKDLQGATGRLHGAFPLEAVAARVRGRAALGTRTVNAGRGTQWRSTDDFEGRQLVGEADH